MRELLLLIIATGSLAGGQDVIPPTGEAVDSWERARRHSWETGCINKVGGTSAPQFR
jgi:hypothetical protein